MKSRDVVGLVRFSDKMLYTPIGVVLVMTAAVLLAYPASDGNVNNSQSGYSHTSDTSHALYLANQGVYLGYIPAGYTLAPRLPNAPFGQCPPQMNASACAIFKLSYANGVCDPNETYLTDPLDCGCTGAVVGNPVTGRCTAPATVCQLTFARQLNGQG